MSPTLKQDEAITETLKFLSKSLNMRYEIIDYPDKRERNLPACDALAIIGSKKVAIEHTSVDSVPQQRRDSARFMKVLGPLDLDLKNKLPTPGSYWLSVHMNAIPALKRKEWDGIRNRIHEWCLKVANSLEIGSPYSAPKHFVRAMPEGVPFEVTLYRWPGEDGRFLITRLAPNDLEDQRKDAISQTISSRGSKVSDYRIVGYRTILVLESNDIALANASLIGQAFIRAAKDLNSMIMPDEVYLVETEMKPYYVHCLKFGESCFPNITISKEQYKENE